MLSQKKRIMTTVVVLWGVVGIILGVFVSQYLRNPQARPTQSFHGTWLENPRTVSSFSFQTTDGHPFDNARLKNHWTMLFFGFTSCPSICPVTMAELGKMYRILESQGVEKLPEVVLISLDPKRDSLEVVQRYVQAFHPHFLGAKGVDERSVKAFAREMGIAYTKVATTKVGDTENYTIEHTGTVMLLNPEGQLRAFFTMPHKAEDLALDYQQAIKIG